jgi:hypothetical protein
MNLTTAIVLLVAGILIAGGIKNYSDFNAICKDRGGAGIGDFLAGCLGTTVWMIILAAIVSIVWAILQRQ